MKKKEYARYSYTKPKLGVNGWITEIITFDVEVMARAGKYAMVRRKGSNPFVASLNELVIDKATGKTK